MAPSRKNYNSLNSSRVGRALVTVLASPMLLPLTSGVAACPEAQGPEAGRQLGIPEGSVASRLARVMLAKRLTRLGVEFSGGSVAAGSASASAPPALVASTIRATSLLAAGLRRASRPRSPL